MNENFDALRSTLMGLGFGVDPNLDHRLGNAFALDQPEFALYVETRFDNATRIVAKLYITAPDQGQARLTKYDARLYYGVESVRNRHHTFPGDGITFKESYNLLQGRSIYKELASAWTGLHHAWIQLDFNHIGTNAKYKFRGYSESHGFDLEKVLSKYPIAELDYTEKKAVLLASLKKGNLHPVTAVKKTKTERWMIAANPQFKTINIYPLGKSQPPADFDPNRKMN